MSRKSNHAKLREAATLALEALECGDTVFYPQTKAAIHALRSALAEPEQEQERNFCPRCGKRSWPDTIHTCTPPQIGEQQ